MSGFAAFVMMYIFIFSLTGTYTQDFSYQQIYNKNANGTTIKRKLNKKNVTTYIGYANNPFGSSMRVYGHLNGLDLSNLFHMEEELSTKNETKADILTESETNFQYRNTSQEARSKRGVIHLYNMVSCATGCNPLKYKGYGCFCGFLGSGFPVDGIDRCCKTHDWCYNASQCPMFLEYFVPYLWKCYYNRPLCALNNRNFGGRNSCASRLCECDRVLSECLSRYPCPSSRAFCRSAPLRLLQNAFMIFP